MDGSSYRKSAWFPLALIVGLATCAVAPLSVLGQPSGAYVGMETCLDCHEDYAVSFARNAHGRLSDYQYPGQARDCETCHGPGATHADSGEPADIGRFDVDMGEPVTASCLTCHKAGTLFNWDMGPHANSDISCVDCHQMHGAEARHALLSDDEPGLCFPCHEDTKAKFYMPSHHPLKEGFMVCSSCHDQHGDTWAGIMEAERMREMCLTCHPHYQGPFIFEHSPVEEGCEICHDPHGTVANNLLRQNEPFLCLQCHQPHFHAGIETIEGSYSPSDAVIEDYPPYDGLAGESHANSFKRVMMTKCTQCHQAVHGTDLPSQSIPGQGRALNR